MLLFIIKNSIRHLKRNKLFTFLNILGLTIGISSCWVIFKYVSYELAYEKGISNKNNVYRLLTQFKTEDSEELFSGVSRPIYFELKRDKLGLDLVVANYKKQINTVIIPEIPGQEKKFEEPEYDETTVIETDKEYFDLVDYKWLAGNKQTALIEPHHLVLTEKRAKHYFPKLMAEEMIGKTIIYNDSLKKTITGVIEDLNYPSEFNGQEFLLLQETEREKRLISWAGTNGADRIYFQDNDPQIIENAIKQMQSTLIKNWKQVEQQKLVDFSFNRKLVKMPLLDSHFANYMKENAFPKTSKTLIFTLIAVALFLLILACINYVNLTSSQLPLRHKEIGIRKTLGGSKRSLILQMMCETAIIVIFSATLSIIVTHLVISFLHDFFPESRINYTDPILFLIVMVCLLIFTILIAGLYPSWIMSRMNVIDIFRNKSNIQIGKENLNLRKSLIVFQFIIAQLFIVGAIIISQQLKYVVKKDMGFNKESVIRIHIPYKVVIDQNLYNKRFTLLQELRKLPGVDEISMGTAPLSMGYMSNSLKYFPDDKSDPITRNIYFKNIDTAYLSFFDFKLIAGTPLIPSDTTNGYLINETAVKAYGFKNPQEAIGKFIGNPNRMIPIVGVIKDFHTSDFYTPIGPIALSYNNRDLEEYNIRLNPNIKSEWPKIIENINNTWNKFYNSDLFNYKHYDETILAFYKKEQQLLKLINISTTIAIIISCLGLFGLATLIANQRSKEIGIRKILGASVSGIIGLLSKGFIKIITIAILIASPIIWWASNEWLKDFAYRIEVSWLPFILGGLVAITAALLTISYQAIKAAKANPVNSLRDE